MMSKKKYDDRKFKFETFNYVGQEHSLILTDARAVPIYQTTLCI